MSMLQRYRAKAMRDRERRLAARKGVVKKVLGIRTPEEQKVLDEAKPKVRPKGGKAKVEEVVEKDANDQSA